MEKLLALHRYYIGANRFREHFEDKLSSFSSIIDSEELFISDCGLFLSHWYAALYVVIEGWKETKLTDTIIDSLLSSENVELLKRFRNGIYHYQQHYYDPRFLNLLEAEDIVPWVRQLNQEFGRYFLTHLETTN
ncbi:MAG: hypothetical protein DU481_07445 [Nitrosomonas sp.]